ncbi:U32 family peptidase [Ruminococcus sp. Marseille-P6503]|uniref:U32 family peptidase n=1 Tax=Ruminococcus sp. Marseille-P6503 TaxID=2364796 RepID=UPI000F54244C|nr:U32 family peptidase [Ruminococcus sp. Marseille-P6503]
MTEILAPCGSPEALDAALRTGCDAVYLGGEGFSARQNAVNFSRRELEKAVYDCHVRGVRVYQAINTAVTDDQLEQLKDTVSFACRIGIDGLITQDLALVRIVRECCPDMEIHASTQMTLHTERGVLLAKEMGFSRAVVSRELPADIIKQLCGLPIEIEVFVHGALCMSVSGQCYMSAVIGSRSANRGLCAQACRLPVSALKNRSGRYDLSLKDMSYIGHIRELAQSGAAAFKIEGRMKRPEYTACAVDSVRKALDGEPYDMQTLENVFSRGGFTDGYYNRKTGPEMFGIRQKEDVLSSAEVLPFIHRLYRREYKRSTVSMFVRMKKNERLYISACDENGITAEARGEVPQEALKRSADRDYLERQLSKLGDTVYELGRLEAEVDRGLMCPASQLNALRRELCAELDRKRYEYHTKKPVFTRTETDMIKAKKISKPKLRLSVTDLNQLSAADIKKAELVICSSDALEKGLSGGSAVKLPADKLAAEMPRFTFDEERDFTRLKALRERGVSHLVCTNYAHISMGRELGMTMHGGFGLNVTNSAALAELKRLGLADCTASFELKIGQINALSGQLPFGVIGYGRLPLMLTVNCPIRQASGCKSCTGSVRDRTGRVFPVKCSRRQGYTEILNSDILYMGDRLEEFKTAAFVQLDFYDENPGEVKRIIESVENRRGCGIADMTRGLYYRGVL